MVSEPLQLPLAANEFTLPIPTGWIAPIDSRFYGVEWGPLKHVDPKVVRRHITYDGSGNMTKSKPTMYYTDMTNIVFDCMALRDYTLEFTHYQQQLPLAKDTNESNFLTIRYPMLVYYVCLFFANRWLKDVRGAQTNLQLAEEAVSVINGEYDRSLMYDQEWVQEAH